MKIKNNEKCLCCGKKILHYATLKYNKKHFCSLECIEDYNEAGKM